MMATAAAGGESVESWRLIQISDCHLGRDPGGELLGLNSDASLADVVDAICQREDRIDGLLATGDLAGEGDLSAYQRFQQVTLSRFSTPTACLPGNHDEPALMQQALGALMSRQVFVGNWHLLLLNSRIAGSEGGALAEAELDFLAQALAQHPDKPTLVFLHHQVQPVGSVWLDRHIVRNAADLQALLARHSQVRAVISGHVHQASDVTVNSLRWLTTPSTCIQFLPGSSNFALDTAMPGYRWFSLFADGRFETGVERVSDRDYGIDWSSDGY